MRTPCGSKFTSNSNFTFTFVYHIGKYGIDPNVMSAPKECVFGFSEPKNAGPMYKYYNTIQRCGPKLCMEARHLQTNSDCANDSKMPIILLVMDVTFFGGGINTH